MPAIVFRENAKKQALSVERRATWLARIRREDLVADTTEFYRVCGDHFIPGTQLGVRVPDVKFDYLARTKFQPDTHSKNIQNRKEDHRRVGRLAIPFLSGLGVFFVSYHLLFRCPITDRA